MFATICIGIVVALYMLLWCGLLFWVNMSLLLNVLLGIPMLALLFLWIHVVKERVEEIRSGEKDDLSKY